MIPSDSVFDSKEWVFGVKLSDEEIVKIECLRDVAMATNFRTTLVVNGLGRKITPWGFRIKDGLFSVNPYVCWSHSLSGFVLAAVGTAPRGRLSGWELTR